MNKPSQAADKAQFLKENLKKGEHYVGLILGKNGEPDHHLYLLPPQAERMSWAKALEWAKSQGGELPTRREQSLLFANVPELFQAAWYWSGEQHASYSVCAWVQGFGNGGQYCSPKSGEYRACAIRRSKIS